MNRETFHKDGATEVRATILTAGKRVDIHVFGDDAANVLGLAHLIRIAADDMNADGHKIEIDSTNMKDFEAKK